MNNIIDAKKHKEITDRLKFGNRICSDGLCCFLTHEFARERGLEMYSPISYLSLKKDGRIYENRRLACASLDVSLEDDTITFKCKSYNSEFRNPYCRIYPEEGVIALDKGRFKVREFVPAQTCTAAWLKRDKDKGVEAYPFYLFDTEKFPQFEPYALAVEENHFLVPVPRLR